MLQDSGNDFTFLGNDFTLLGNDFTLLGNDFTLLRFFRKLGNC